MSEQFDDHEVDDNLEKKQGHRPRVRGEVGGVMDEVNFMPSAPTPAPREPVTSPALVAPYGNNRNYAERRGGGNRFTPVITGEPEEATVKWFNPEKGFGFLTDNSGKDLFVHISVMRAAGLSNLVPEQKVMIRRGPGRKGGEAANQIIPS